MQFSLDKLLNNTFYYHEPDFFNPYLRKNVKGKRCPLYDPLLKRLPFGFSKMAYETLNKEGFKVEVKNYWKPMSKPVPHPIKTELDLPFSLMKFQEEAVAVALKERYGVIEVPTGGGKTAIIQKLITEVNASISIVITEGSALVSQTAKQIAKEIKNVSVVQWGDGKTDKIEGKGNLPIVIVTTYQSFSKQVTNPFLKNIDLVVIDECHNIAAEMFSLSAKYIPNPYWRIGLTATGERKNEDTILIQAYLGKKLYEVSYGELVRLKRICPVKIHRINLANMGEDSMKSFLKGRKTLIVTELISNQNKILESYPFLDGLNGRTPKKKLRERFEKFNDAVSDCIVATGIFNTGINCPSIDTIILFKMYASPVRIKQLIGRSQRYIEGKEYSEVYHHVETKKDMITYREVEALVYTKCEAYEVVK